MKHSILFKFIVILLTALSLVTAVGGVAGIVVMEGAGLYVNGLDALQDQQYRAIAETLANTYACQYITQEMDTCPEVLQRNLYSDILSRFDREVWGVRLSLENQVLSEVRVPHSWAAKIDLTVDSEYPIAVPYLVPSPELPETTPSDSSPDLTDPEPTQAPTMPDGWRYNSLETVWDQGALSVYRLYYYPGPTYNVTVYLQEQALQTSSLHLLTDLYAYRYTFIGMLAMGLIAFASGFAFLMYAAGHAPDGAIRPGGLNRLPLDIYFLLAAVGVFLLSWLFSYLREWTVTEGPHPGNLSLMAVTLFLITLLVLGFLFALAAQVKLKNGFWWRKSCLGYCLEKLFHGLELLGKGIAGLARLLPLIWQWLAATLVLMIVTGISLLLFQKHPSVGIFVFLLLPSVGASLALVAYGSYAFGLLLQGARQMAQGSLAAKIPTKYLFGCFRDFANELNALSDTAVTAAQNQMRSERMKSELITNVSHDIKTPLTSIINFVDLLQKPHTPEQNAQYLEILSRQAYQMKQLIADLIDLSKASTGNMSVNLTRLDAGETVNQALGEFSDKLDAAGLTPVFRQPEQPLFINADGRLLWRVLSNLLTNAIQYAMPGTRLYLDLIADNDQVLLSIRNISKEALRLSSEELMERFSQGDASRQSGGSGLGLNIARSLMEVQDGQLQLQLDGDLFKVTLFFPEA